MTLCKHRPHLWMPGPHTDSMKTISFWPFEQKHAHQCPANLILRGSGSDLPVPPAPRKEMAKLLSFKTVLWPPPCPLVYWQVSWHLIHALDTVLLATAHIDVPSWTNDTSWANSVGDRHQLMVTPGVGHWKHACVQKTARKDGKRYIGCGHHLHDNSVLGLVHITFTISTHYLLNLHNSSQMDSMSVAS